MTQLRRNGCDGDMDMTYDLDEKYMREAGKPDTPQKATKSPWAQ